MPEKMTDKRKVEIQLLAAGNLPRVHQNSPHPLLLECLAEIDRLREGNAELRKAQVRLSEFADELEWADSVSDNYGVTDNKCAACGKTRAEGHDTHCLVGITERPSCYIDTNGGDGDEG